MNNILYKDNLVENCIYSIEYFINADVEMKEMHCGRNILFEGNILRFAGSGFGKQRYNPGNEAHIQSQSSSNRFENFVIRGNVFDRSTKNIFRTTASHNAYLPKMEGNTYIQTFGGSGYLFGSVNKSKFDISAILNIKYVLGDRDARVFFTK